MYLYHSEISLVASTILTSTATVAVVPTTRFDLTPITQLSTIDIVITTTVTVVIVIFAALAIICLKRNNWSIHQKNNSIFDIFRELCPCCYNRAENIQAIIRGRIYRNIIYSGYPCNYTRRNYHSSQYSSSFSS